MCVSLEQMLVFRLRSISRQSQWECSCIGGCSFARSGHWSSPRKLDEVQPTGVPMACLLTGGGVSDDRGKIYDFTVECLCFICNSCHGSSVKERVLSFGTQVPIAKSITRRHLVGYMLNFIYMLDLHNVTHTYMYTILHSKHMVPQCNAQSAVLLN